MGRRILFLLAFLATALAAVLLYWAGSRSDGTWLNRRNWLIDQVNRPTASWVGSVNKQITIRVVDEAMRPLSGASVRLHYLDDQETNESQGETGPDGEFACQLSFETCGEDRLIGSRGWIIFCSHYALAVEASGHERVHCMLEDYAGRRWQSPGPPIPPVVVPLKRVGQ